MADLAQFKKDLEALRTQRTEVSVRLQTAKKQAEKYKEQLQELGYPDLNAAKADYVRRVSELDAKHAQVLDYIKQITQIEGKIPTREAVLEKLRATAIPKEAEAPATEA